MADASSRTLADQFTAVRQLSEDFCTPLATEDYGLQAMAETSPPKWHLAHTTWFFETFLLKPFIPHYQPHHPLYETLFNSYYNGIGQQHPRHQRGLLSRPSVAEVITYRARINELILDLLGDANHPNHIDIVQRIRLGIHHEQQHQELFFTDLKYCFFQNPLFPTYSGTPLAHQDPATREPGWMSFQGDIVSVGFHNTGFHSTSGQGDRDFCFDGFCFDNELPAHQVLLQSFQLSDRLITNGEFLAFMDDGGYRRPELWLADGWAECQQQGWQAPLYWLQQEGQWLEYTLHGLQPLDLERPVCHISAYEADAFARWRGARLPTEFELEQALSLQPVTGQFVESGEFHPGDADGHQLYGTVWEWTSSAYGPYPGYRPAAGAIGEYNGKFMCNQLVLKGGSCVTGRDHIRSSYRNFFYPKDRWQFTGIRLAQSDN